MSLVVFMGGRGAPCTAPVLVPASGKQFLNTDLPLDLQLQTGPSPQDPSLQPPGSSLGGGTLGQSVPTVCTEPEGRGETLAGGAGPCGFPTPFHSTLFPPYGSHKVWAQRQQPEEVAVYRELLCGRGGGGSEEKGEREEVGGCKVSAVAPR